MRVSLVSCDEGYIDEAEFGRANELFGALRASMGTISKALAVQSTKNGQYVGYSAQAPEPSTPKEYKGKADPALEGLGERGAGNVGEKVCERWSPALRPVEEKPPVLDKLPRLPDSAPPPPLGEAEYRA